MLNTLFFLFCKLQIGRRNHAIEYQEDLNNGDKYIVSLTSFPERIGYVWMAIESILRQTSKPDAIILWLSKDEFENKSLPESLLKLQRRGVRIRFVDDNLMPHNKYYFALKNYPRANIITVDDDLIYPPNIIEDLKKYHLEYPASICSTVTRTIKIRGNIIQPYDEWNEIEKIRKSHKFLQLGVGGVLYPPGCLNEEVLNKKIIQEKALKADDLWLKVMSVKNDAEIVSLADQRERSLIPIIIENNVQLMSSNVHHKENDIIFKDLIKYYDINVSKMEEECQLR